MSENPSGIFWLLLYELFFWASSSVHDFSIGVYYQFTFDGAVCDDVQKWSHNKKNF